MPVYEYYCSTCKEKFELRRSMAEMDAPAVCPQGHVDTQRTLSLFMALSKDESGYLTHELGVGGSGPVQ